MTMVARSDRAKEIGSRIVQGRQEAGGMTQPELGELCGVTVRSIQAWESGEVIPFRHLRKLESALGKPAAWFLHGEEAVVGVDASTRMILDRLDSLELAIKALARTISAER